MQLQEWSPIILSISPTLLLETGATIFCLIIVLKLVKLYRSTLVLDYLIFAGMFSSYIGYANPIAHLLCYTNLVIVWQLRNVFLNLTFLFMLIHAVRISWEKTPKILMVFGGGGFLILNVLIVFWVPMVSEEATVLFFLTNLPPHPLPPPIPSVFGAGIAINDSVIYSVGHPLLAYLYYLFCASFLAYAYFFVEPLNPTKRIVSALRIWQFCTVINITAILLLILIPYIYPIASILVFTELFLVGIVVALKYPESMLISYVQVYRAARLYDATRATSETIESPRIELIKNYLEEAREKGFLKGSKAS